jgi:hypothetical protein
MILLNLFGTGFTFFRSQKAAAPVKSNNTSVDPEQQIKQGHCDKNPGRKSRQYPELLPIPDSK